jgi:hypothetical protein
MAFSVSPSVIVREVDASAAVPAIATPPAAVSGVFRWGPVNEPILLSSENDLVSRFGKPTDNNYETFFVAADYLSYANALWAARVDNGAATADAYDIVLFDADTAYANTAAPGYVQGTTAGSVGSVDTSNTTFAAFEGLYPGALANGIEISYVKDSGYDSTLFDVGDIPATNPSLSDARMVSGQDLGASDQAIAFNTATIDITVANTVSLDVSGLVGDILVIGNESVGYQELSIASATKSNLNIDLDPSANTDIVVGYHRYQITTSSNYTLAESDLEDLSISTKWKQGYLFGKAPDTGNYHVAVIDSSGGVTGAAGSVVEIYDNVSTSASATLPDGRTNYYVDVIENFSSWVKVANTAHFEAQTTSQYETLAGGTDGTTEGATSLQALAGGYDLFKNSNEIDISFVLQGKGDNNANLANYIISNVADYRKDCVAFLSPSKEAVVDELRTNAKMTNTIAYRNKLQSSSYWFMDSGYKYRYDKYNDKYRYVPLNGDMAGLASRVEPYESPAGFRKGVVKNVVKLAFNPNKAQRDQLYTSDINPVMSQVGQGIVLFGDKTGLGLNSAFDRLNVRRLFIAVEKAIANAAQSFLFELNDEFTQTQFRNIVEPFLRDIQGRRGIIDFRVVSDATVNTPVVIDQNKFRANIFIKPARSINVIELTFVATRSGVEFEEIVGALT